MFRQGDHLAHEIVLLGLLCYSKNIFIIRSLKISEEFSEFIRAHTKEEDEIMVSFDVKALYTNVPIENALAIIKELLENDETLPDWMPLSPKNVLDLLDFFCVQCS